MKKTALTLCGLLALAGCGNAVPEDMGKQPSKAHEIKERAPELGLIAIERDEYNRFKESNQQVYNVGDVLSRFCYCVGKSVDTAQEAVDKVWDDAENQGAAMVVLDNIPTEEEPCLIGEMRKAEELFTIKSRKNTQAALGQRADEYSTDMSRTEIHLSYVSEISFKAMSQPWYDLFREIRTSIISQRSDERTFYELDNDKDIFVAPKKVCYRVSRVDGRLLVLDSDDWKTFYFETGEVAYRARERLEGCHVNEIDDMLLVLQGFDRRAFYDLNTDKVVYRAPIDVHEYIYRVGNRLLVLDYQDNRTLYDLSTGEIMSVAPQELNTLFSCLLNNYKGKAILRGVDDTLYSLEANHTIFSAYLQKELSYNQFDIALKEAVP